MHHWSLRCSHVFLLVLAAGCGGGDFVRKDDGKGGVYGGADASTGAVTGSGGTRSSGGSSSGGLSSGGSSTSGGTTAAGGRKGGGVPDASAGGVDAGSSVTTDAGEGSAGMGAGGGSGTAGAGGDVATGGAGNGGTSSGSGGVSGCTNPTTWYVDDDQDGYGSTTTPAMVLCIPPPGHFTKVGGDCDDSNDMVHPQLTAAEIQYFSKPYQTPAGIDSFDYDCSTKEEGDPGQAKAASTCPALSLGTCGGSGYRPVSTGNRVAANGYCGSRSYRTCVNAAALCTAQDVTNFTDAYRCK